MNDFRIYSGYISHHAGINNLRRFTRIFLVINGHFFGQNQSGILARKAYSPSAFQVDPGYHILVHLAAQHHFHHIHGGIIRVPHALDKGGGDPHGFKHLIDLGTAAMDHHRIDPDGFKQTDVLGEIGFQFFIHHGVSAIFDHHGFSGKSPDIG